jgi:hypothetical protein
MLMQMVVKRLERGVIRVNLWLQFRGGGFWRGVHVGTGDERSGKQAAKDEESCGTQPARSGENHGNKVGVGDGMRIQGHKSIGGCTRRED